MSTAENEFHYPPTYINDVAIELHSKYEFDNHPHQKNEDSGKPFVGRRKEKEKFTLMLDSLKGVYLVTGYRGMGKTSFVNVVLHELHKLREENKKGKRLCEIRMSLAQKHPTEIEIMRLMVSTLRTVYRKEKGAEKKEKLLEMLTWVFRVCLITFVTLFLSLLLQNPAFKTLLSSDHPASSGSAKLAYFVCQLLMAATLIVIAVCGIIILIYKFKDKYSFGAKIDRLYRRCYAASVIESGSGNEVAIQLLGAKIVQGGKKQSETYPIASSKEIEYELTKLLEEMKSQQQFVFIFDELDKVEEYNITKEAAQGPQVGVIRPSKEKAALEEIRSRKRAVLDIIASLKNFLTDAPAPFIFIAGREMFDASMADIADRQSSISSIFNYVFYVESLLKDIVDGRSSLCSAIEDYLYETILRTPPGKQSLYTKVADENDNTLSFEQRTKLNLVLQSFVTYLAYRSNGSPKKLTRLVHEFIRPELSEDLIDPIIWPNPNNPKDVPYRKHYLYFSYSQQQRIGFINYIYRPFLVKYGSSFTKYSDTLIVSTSYLFDHLFKFHPYAFSYSHLEQIPEVLSTNKTPALHDHIKKIMDYLLGNHIKETGIGLFDFKFYSKTVNEIYYLSKTFEEESAAFNFTLDETYSTKLHVKERLVEIKSSYEKYPLHSDSQSPLIFSIAYLNGVLGDLHFFDQEYDEAITAYSDVIKPIKSLDVSIMNTCDFILLLKYKLKLGLVFEKVKSFEESLSQYTDAIQDANRFLADRLARPYLVDELELREKYRRTANADRAYYINSSLSDVLQIINQASLALIILQEKMGVEGMTAQKSSITMGDYLALSEKVSRHCGNNTTIISNFFLQIANLLYFKNSINAFEWHKKDKNPLPKRFRDDIRKMKFYNRRFIKTTKGLRKPVMALNLYFLGLQYLLSGRIVGYRDIEYSSGQTVMVVLKALAPSVLRKHYGSLSKIHFKYIASYLSSIGDCLLCALGMDLGTDNPALTFEVKSIFDTDRLAALKVYLKGRDKSINGGASAHEKIVWGQGESYALLEALAQNSKELSPITIVRYYFLSSFYYTESGRIRSASLQLRKILYLFRLIIGPGQKEDADAATDFLFVLENTVVKMILESASATSEYSDSHDFFKFKDTQKANDPNDLLFIRNNLSNHPDTREAIILFSHIKLRVQHEVPETESLMVNSKGMISTQYQRLLELTYAAKFYERRLDPKNDSTPAGEIRKKDCIGYLHSLISVARIMEIYDNDFLVGYSFTAYHHYRIAKFFSFTNEGKNHLKIGQELAKECAVSVQEISGDRSSYSLFDPNYQFSLAAKFYDKAIKLHSAGTEYKSALNEIVYLEDDLNDASYHFGAAMDRFLLTSEKLHKLYRECREGIEPDWNGVKSFIISGVSNHKNQKENASSPSDGKEKA